MRLASDAGDLELAFQGIQKCAAQFASTRRPFKDGLEGLCQIIHLCEAFQDRFPPGPLLLRRDSYMSRHISSKKINSLCRNVADPQKLTEIGILLCFSKGDWVRGLPYFMQTKNLALASLAQRNPNELNAFMISLLD